MKISTAYKNKSLWGQIFHLLILAIGLIFLTKNAIYAQSNCITYSSTTTFQGSTNTVPATCVGANHCLGEIGNATFSKCPSTNAYTDTYCITSLSVSPGSFTPSNAGCVPDDVYYMWVVYYTNSASGNPLQVWDDPFAGDLDLESLNNLCIELPKTVTIKSIARCVVVRFGNENVIREVEAPNTSLGYASSPMSINSKTVCAGQPITMSVDGAPVDATYTWVLPNGQTITQTQIDISNAAVNPDNGTYTVDVKSNFSCPFHGTATLTVIPVCIQCVAVTGIAAAANPATVSTGSTSVLSVTASAGISPTTTFLWSGPNGFSSTEQNPSTGTLTTTGGYTYSVTVINEGSTNTCTATATTSLTVNTAPTPCTALSALTATATPSSLATGSSSTLNVTGTGITAGTTTFSWAGGSAGSPGGFTATTQNPSTGALATAGAYSYTVTATNANGAGICTATATTSLTVSTVPTPCTALSALTATATPSSLATGSSSMLNVTGTGITAGTTTFSWAGTGGFTATTQSPSTGALATAGAYSYTVTATNANGTGICTTTATTSLTVSTTVVACINPTFTGAAVQVTCTGANPNTDGKLTISAITNGDKVAYSTGATYTGTATYSTATLISTLSPAGTVVGNLANPAANQQYTMRVYNSSNTCYTDQTVTLIPKNCVSPCGTPNCGTVTIRVN